MGNIIVEFTREHYSKDKDIKQLMAYIAGEGSNIEKETSYVGAHGLRKDYEVAAQQIIRMQEGLRKNSKRRMYHIIVSLPENVQKIDKVKRVAKRIGKMLFIEEGHQVFYGDYEEKSVKVIKVMSI